MINRRRGRQVAGARQERRERAIDEREASGPADGAVHAFDQLPERSWHPTGFLEVGQLAGDGSSGSTQQGPGSRRGQGELDPTLEPGVVDDDWTRVQA